VLCVEFFLAPGGRLLVNEVAPRPHNSGHFTLDACATSQFEQQLRAVCGLPLGDPAQRAPAAMANLLGDRWARGEPNWAAALARPGVRLHLYGKREPRPGRKMGHLTVVGEAARERVVGAREAVGDEGRMGG
jgi:5-(carboxyamino)imidazole ribonucleotide synthase